MTFKGYSNFNIKHKQAHKRKKEREKKQQTQIFLQQSSPSYQSRAMMRVQVILIYSFHGKKTNLTVLCDLQSFEVCLIVILSGHDDTLLGSVQSSGDYERQCKRCHIIVLLCLSSAGKESHAQPT